MGLGARLSKSFDKQHIISGFIFTELILSLLVSFVAIICYLLYGISEKSWIFIYLFSVVIGLLIGLEIPLAMRINDKFESLEHNISNILEYDYYGSLIGGLFFAFIGLPYLGLTYTPFILGLINFCASFWLFQVLKHEIKPKTRKIIYWTYTLLAIVLLVGVLLAKPLIKYGEQAKYKDKVVYEKQTRYQKIVMTQWMDNFSLYINGNQQLSSFDEYLYHEPMVHPIMTISKYHQNILVLGGGDGCLVREILKHDNISNITLVDLDPEMTILGKSHPLLLQLNNSALNDNRIKIVNQDAFQFVEQTKELYDVIFVDLPDPNSVDLNKLYTKEFYKLTLKKLSKEGLFITQSGSPYYATKAFYCIKKTMESAGFKTFPLHNQVLTLGEWGWMIGSRNKILKDDFQNLNINTQNLKWLNKESLSQISSFGKPLVDTSGIVVNTIFKPTLYTYYKAGNWNLF